MQQAVRQELAKEVMDFPPPPLLIERFAKEHPCTLEEAYSAFDETKRFLFLCGTSNGGSSAPSVMIDKMWHEFMLFTRTYRSFCQEFFGCFIDHEPSAGSETHFYQNTRERAECEFGKLNARYWPKMGAASAHCSSCDNCVAVAATCDNPSGGDGKVA